MSAPVNAGPPAVDPPAPDAIQEARDIVAAMRANPRGPYANIRWFCKDGTILPPTAGACRPHDGGIQHATYSDARTKLRALGYPVGTIFADLERNPESLPGRRHARLRDTVLEQYMIDIDDGWVLHRARDYRGRVQIEDETASGRRLLLAALTETPDPQDVLALREIVRAVPHGNAEGDVMRRLRRDSQILSDRTASFAALRAEIHGNPTLATISRVESWLAGGPRSDADHITAKQISADLEALYGESGLTERLTSLSPTLGRISQDLGTVPQSVADHVTQLSKLLTRLLDPQTTAANRLVVIDAMLLVESSLLRAVQETRIATRAGALQRAELLVRAARSLGYLSAGEAARAVTSVNFEAEQNLSEADYAKAIDALGAVPIQAAGNLRYSFAEALSRYTALDGRAARFIDDRLRGSALLPLADLTRRMNADLTRVTGRTADLAGENSTAIVLNPGVARGRIRILGTEDVTGSYGRDDIIVVPDTSEELLPAKGFVTVGDGNPLSHIQLLARNLGIPNVVIDRATRDRLRRLDGQYVELAASSDGRVRLKEMEPVAAPASKLEAPKSIARGGTVKAPKPDLSRTSPLPLAELNAGLSGRYVGPKAANVGELAKLFPDRVADAVALPFGAFAESVAAPRARVARAFEAYRKGDMTESAFLAELATARTETTALKLSDAQKSALRPLLPDAGVFVRSDTNMEDLPQFTGAGLNKTVANVVGADRILDTIPEVWASVFTERAMAWRSQILENPQDVFSSILLMQSVPSEKSGVLVTQDITGRKTSGGLTVSVAHGVGGAVDNESAASYLLTPTDTFVLSEAKAPYQRRLSDKGGLTWVEAPRGPVLTDADTDALRFLAAEVVERYPLAPGPDGKPLPFDIEFGFAGGKLYLLQIRPLIQSGAAAADSVLGPAPKRNLTDLSLSGQIDKGPSRQRMPIIQPKVAHD